MCGIVGLIDQRQVVEAATLARMRDALMHRGPDDAGLWIADSGPPWAGLGHRRLSILDLSPAGRQPMHSACGRYVLVFNGEIYNYLELAADLEARGHRFRSHTDTEVLLAALVCWGPACLDRLNGMWAFALWDSRERRLFAARDRFGKKPFYYHWDGRRLAFASEMKSLFQHPEIACRPDEDELTAYTQSLLPPTGPQTMFAGIRQLMPAHYLTLDREGRFDIRRYWQLDPERRLDLPSTKAFVERFQELFENAVRLRLRADVPVGSSLSGGLDSSLIVGTVAKLRGQQQASAAQHTFSARFPGEATFDEGAFIDAVVESTGVEAHRTEPDVEGLQSALWQLHYVQEEPFASSSIFAQYEVMRLARRHETIVLLDGQGADELLAGYVAYLPIFWRDLLSAGRWRQAVHEYRSYTRRQALASRQFPHLAMRTPMISLESLWDRLWRRRAVGRGRGEKHTMRDGLLDEPVVAPGEGHCWASQQWHPGTLIERQQGHRSTTRLWRRLAADVVETSLPLLLRYADRNAMAFSVEVRNPFLDYRLVELAMSLPDDVKIRDGWTKFVARAAGRRTVPRVVRRRADKVGYITPEDQWLRGGLRGWAEAALFGPRLAEVPGYSRDRMQRTWQAHQSGRRHLRQLIWPWLSLHEWLSMIDAGELPRGIATGRSSARAA